MKTIKTIVSVFLITATLACLLTSCKDKQYEAYDRTGQPYDYYLPDYVKVCNYEGIEVPSVVYAPSETDISNKIKQLAGYYCARTEDPDRPCQKYDYVDIITTCKFTDTGETYGLFNFEKNDLDQGQTFLLGTNNFWFPALDDAVEGMSQGETKTVTLTLPDPFYKDYLNSGREVEMTIYLNYIDEVDYSGVDDQFYYEHYGYYGETMRSAIIEDLKKSNNEAIEGYELALAWNYVCENSKLKKVPEKEYQEEYDSLLNTARQTAESNDLSLLEYVKKAYKFDSLDEFYDYLKDKAENRCYEDMLLYYIIRYENLSYTDEYYETCILSMTEAYNLTDPTEAEDFLLYYLGAEKLHESVLMQYTQDWIAEKTKVRDDVHQFFSDKLN